MTRDEWGRCVVQLRGAWPVHLRDEAWPSVWYRTLSDRSFKAVAHAVIRIVKQPFTFPPSLGVFLEFVLVEEHARGLAPPKLHVPEVDPDDLWRALNPGLEPPPPMTREAALARIRRLGFVVTTDEESTMEE